MVRVRSGDLLLTDDPYAEGKEHIGGFMIVEAPDLDAALGWARKLARALTLAGHPDGLPIGMRPVQER